MKPRLKAGRRRDGVLIWCAWTPWRKTYALSASDACRRYHLLEKRK